MNLYEVLGVRPDASPDDIHQAFRKKAKTAHPDGGGSVDAFAQVDRAARILGDPMKRLEYDRTGNAEEPKPDNETALALEMIQTLISQAIQQEIAPHVDLLAIMRREIERAQGQAKSANAELAARRLRLGKLAKRFKAKAGESLIGRMIEGHSEECGRAIAANDQKIAIAARALAILGGYEFAVEAAPPSP